MKNILTFFLLALLLAASVPVYAAALRPAGGDDQIVARLAPAALPAGEFERAPVQFAWVLDPFAELTTPPPFTAESREYWLQTDAESLRAGFAFDTTAPGAVLRISPEPGATAVTQGGIAVRRADSQPGAAAIAFAKQTSAEQFAAQGVPAVTGSMVVQLPDTAGAGAFRLTMKDASGRYLVHVFEPNSRYVLTAQANRSSVLAGESLLVGSELRRDGRVLATATEGVVLAPDGRSYPLTFKDGTARVTLPERAATVPGLWEVHLVAGTVDGDTSIQRDARTAIAVVQPTARLAGSYRFNAPAMRFSLPVQTAASGRYQLSGVLYASDGAGVARPVSMAHAAAWLERGKGEIALQFPREHVPMGFGAPYELRQLTLTDQTRLGVLETRALAVREAVPGGRR